MHIRPQTNSLPYRIFGSNLSYYCERVEGRGKPSYSSTAAAQRIEQDSLNLITNYSTILSLPLPATEDFAGSYIASAETGGKVKVPRVTARRA